MHAAVKPADEGGADRPLRARARIDALRPEAVEHPLVEGERQILRSTPSSRKRGTKCGNEVTIRS